MKLVNFLLLLIALTIYSGSVISSPDNSIRVTLVTDQGVMISSGDISILVDGLDDNIRQDLLSAEPPFSAVDLAFISHGHSDHFQPGIAREFLHNHPETTLAVAPGIVAKIKHDFDGYARISRQIKTLETQRENVVSARFPDFEGHFIEFSHAVSPLYPEDVIGFMVTVAGKKFFYIGEAEMTPDHWLKQDMTSQHIDVVILPYWTFKEEMTRAVLSSRIAPKNTIAIMDTGQAVDGQLRKPLEGLGRVHFLNQMLQTVEIE